MPKGKKEETKVQAIGELVEEEEKETLEEGAEDEGYEDEEEGTYVPGTSYYDNDGDEVLFPDGPKVSKVEEWKSRFGAVYYTEFDEEIFLWHTLSRKEYKDIMKVQNADTYYKEERICDKCIIWPAKYDFLKMSNGKAGIPSLLAEQIMDKSGFTAKVGAYRI